MQVWSCEEMKSNRTTTTTTSQENTNQYWCTLFIQGTSCRMNEWNYDEWMKCQLTSTVYFYFLSVMLRFWMRQTKYYFWIVFIIRVETLPSPSTIKKCLFKRLKISRLYFPFNYDTGTKISPSILYCHLYWNLWKVSFQVYVTLVF